MVEALKTPDFMTVAVDQWQLINGVPQAMAPADGTHAVIKAEVGGLIRAHLAAHRPGCRVLMNPGVTPRIDNEDHVRIPDIGVTCKPVPRGVALIAEPILLIEILSPGNPAQIWANVWSYPTIPSVLEILAIRTTTIGVQLLRRGPDGAWPEVPLPIETGTLTLDSIGFRVPLADLYAGTWLAEPA
jgi:Uma2 family endonuclease